MVSKVLKYKTLKRILFIILIIFIIYKLFSFYFLCTSKNKNNFSKILTKDIELFGTNEEIYVYDKSFFVVTTDGVTLYDIFGNIKWNYTLNMMYEPIITENNEYLCIGEHKGKNLYVFNLSGLCYEKNFEYPILSFSVNNRGYSSVILENRDNYILYVNDENGNILTKGEIQDKNIFPIATAISKNNKIFAVSFLDINNFISSKIFFYYINEKGTEELLDNMFSSILNLEDQILSKIKFMDNNKFIGVSDKQLLGIEVGKNNNTKVKWNVDFNNKVKYVDFMKDKFISIIFEENRNNIENNIKIYNLDGKITGTYNIKEKINYLKNNFNNIVIKVGDSNKKAYGINNKGKIIFEYNDTKDIKYINFIENSNKILITTPTELKILFKHKGK